MHECSLLHAARARNPKRGIACAQSFGGKRVVPASQGTRFNEGAIPKYNEYRISPNRRVWFGRMTQKQSRRPDFEAGRVTSPDVHGKSRIPMDILGYP